MTRHDRDRLLRRLDKAEGYLLLELPNQALEILESQSDWNGFQFEAALLMGEALRGLGRYREALEPLERAYALRPGDLGAAVCLGWCYKRTHRLAQAIDALERALRKHPDEAILHYNLACYWSLAGQLSRAIQALHMALTLDPDYFDQALSESDFDPIRQSAEFQKLIQNPQVPRQLSPSPSDPQ